MFRVLPVDKTRQQHTPKQQIRKILVKNSYYIEKAGNPKKVGRQT